MKPLINNFTPIKYKSGNIECYFNNKEVPILKKLKNGKATIDYNSKKLTLTIEDKKWIWETVDGIDVMYFPYRMDNYISINNLTYMISFVEHSSGWIVKFSRVIPDLNEIKEFINQELKSYYHIPEKLKSIALNSKELWKFEIVNKYLEHKYFLTRDQDYYPLMKEALHFEIVPYQDLDLILETDENIFYHPETKEVWFYTSNEPKGYWFEGSAKYRKQYFKEFNFWALRFKVDSSFKIEIPLILNSMDMFYYQIEFKEEIKHLKYTQNFYQYKNPTDKPFFIWVDHLNQNYLFIKSNLNPCVEGASLIEEGYFNIYYIDSPKDFHIQFFDLLVGTMNLKFNDIPIVKREQF